MKPSDVSWLHMCVVLRQLARNCLHCCEPIHSYTSHLEMLRHMVYTLFWLMLIVYHAVISYQKLSVLALIADKLPFML